MDAPIGDGVVWDKGVIPARYAEWPLLPDPVARQARANVQVWRLAERQLSVTFACVADTNGKRDAMTRRGILEEFFDIDEARKFFDRAKDPGFVYLLEDRGRFKLGRTTSPRYRLSVARTWIPDIKVVAMKPFWFHRAVEWYTQIGLAMFHYQGEWFDFRGDEFEETFIEEFTYFEDANPIQNSLSFPYFINGCGMNEFTLEWSKGGVSKRRFLTDNSSS